MDYYVILLPVIIAVLIMILKIAGLKNQMTESKKIKKVNTDYQQKIEELIKNNDFEGIYEIYNTTDIQLIYKPFYDSIKLI